MNVDTLNLVVALGVAGLLVWRAIIVAQVALDARRRGFASCEVIHWLLVAVLVEDRYWWGARLDRLAVPEARELLIDLARAHNLLSVVDVRCPLCDREIRNALAVADNGELYVRRNAACPHCDFRVDACRHCAHFQPATGGFTMFDQRGDVGYGRCSFYRAVESARTAYPQHASRMEALGYDMLPVGKPLRIHTCRWPNAQSSPSSRTSCAKTASPGSIGSASPSFACTNVPIAVVSHFRVSSAGIQRFDQRRLPIQKSGCSTRCAALGHDVTIDQVVSKHYSG